MKTTLACCLMVLLPAVAYAAEKEELDVLVVLPTFGQAVFGEVAVGADVYPPSADVERVEFYLDGRLVGEVAEPPWIYIVDAGEENAEHRFRVVVYEASGGQAESEVTTPKIETDEVIDIDLQQLYITVENAGERVLDLKRQDFAVFDNGERQQIITYERGDVPFTAVILVDASTSMRGRRLRLALEGAEAFVAGIKELDEAKLILFSDRAIHETPFTSFASVLTVGLAGVKAGGGTALNDHLYLALKRLEPRKGRKVVVILSDGVDVESFLSMDRVRWMASQEQPVVYWIRLFNERAEDASAQRWSGWRDPEGHKKELELLGRTVAESGGRIETIKEIEEVRGAFQRILDELRNQYVIGYYPGLKTRGERWHKIRVRVRDATLEVRTRNGYLEPGLWREHGGAGTSASD